MSKAKASKVVAPVVSTKKVPQVTAARSVVKAVRVVAEILSSVFGKIEKPVDLNVGTGKFVTFVVPSVDHADIQKLVKSKLQFIFGSQPVTWNQIIRTEGELWSVRCEKLADSTLVEVYFHI